MSTYDIIIAGSGLGGLECAAILSKDGYNVCVLEKNELTGGCFQTYRRKGHLLDTGMHYIGSMEDGQIMNQYFKYFGIMDKLNICRLDKDAFDQIYYKGGIYNYAMGYDNFVDVLGTQFSNEKKNLRRYVSCLQDVGSLISVDNLKKGIIAVEGMKYFSKSAADFIADVTKDEILQNVLAGTSLLYGGIKDVSTLYHHAMIKNSYIESAYRFVDGSSQVSDQLIRVIRENGGTVLNNSEVTRIIVEDELIKGVEVNGEEVIESKYLISNIHPKRTLELLDKNRLIKNAYVSRINSLANTYGIFTLYLVMKKNSYPYLNRNCYLHGNNEAWYNPETAKGKTTNCMISMQVSSENHEFVDVITILTPMYMDELSAWKDTKFGRRGEGYAEFKKKKAHQILQFIREQGLNFDEQIELMYTTTPLSYRDYIGTADGSAYGIIKDYKYPQVGFVSTKTKIKNLFLTGQNLNVHGALGVTLTAMITCAEFLGHEYLAKKVGNA